jgi:maleate cis-trans isomerase
VVCINEAMIWNCLRRAGIEDRFDGFGRLLSYYWPAATLLPAG